MKGFVGRNTARVARVIRDAWIVVGVTAAVILVLEAAYRMQAVARRAVADRFAAGRDAIPPNPFDTTGWAAEYRRDHLREEEVRWAPYVYVRNPTFRGRHMTVDSLGHRVTPQPPTMNDAPTVRIFFMGGSTTFGWFQRDAHTIPAEAARRLQALVGTRARIEATNFGVPGHTFTQEILELILQLRAGARPDVVVFYDGINDVMATVQNGQAGIPQNERNREADFARGVSLGPRSGPEIATDLRVLRHVAVTSGGRLQFVQRILAFKRPALTPDVPADSLARSLVRVFAENARLVEALAVTYGFEPIYVWQPALLSSRKPLTAREQWLKDPGSIGDVHVAVPRMIGAAMTPIVGPRFIDATDLFHDDSLEVFGDLYGHTYERANPRVVDTLMPALSPAVLRAASRARPAAAR